MKKELCAHQETISIMSQAKEAQIKLYKTREDKELDKVIALENIVKMRTRQPIAVPVSTTEPKHNVNQSVATSSKKTVATDSTVKKSRNITRKLYEQVIKDMQIVWYPKYSTIGSTNGNLKTPRCSTVSNTPLSSNSFAARRDNSIHQDPGCSKHMTGILKLLT
ncbi:hypothetical protein Tco_0639569 [Tanacetum coccineum]